MKRPEPEGNKEQLELYAKGEPSNAYFETRCSYCDEELGFVFFGIAFPLCEDCKKWLRAEAEPYT